MLIKQQIQQVLTAARNLPQNTPIVRLEDFVANTLGLTPAQQLTHFPNPDPNGVRARIESCFTKDRQRLLTEECVIPSFVIRQNPAGVAEIGGIATYLLTTTCPPLVVNRLAHHSVVRTALRELQKGLHLEAVAAAIMKGTCPWAKATKGSGDQGIDAIGWQAFLPVHRVVIDGKLDTPDPIPGAKVFALASSKASLDPRSNRPSLINPAHIRELIGGWLIQRSPVGAWKDHEIQMMTPVQMILVTTYRLSSAAGQECRKVGVSVWGLPELTYLVCLHAPQNVFDATQGYTFSKAALKAWWKPFDKDRVAS